MPNSLRTPPRPPQTRHAARRANSVTAGRGPAAVAGSRAGSTQKGGADGQTISPHQPPHPPAHALSTSPRVTATNAKAGVRRCRGYGDCRRSQSRSGTRLRDRGRRAAGPRCVRARESWGSRWVSRPVVCRCSGALTARRPGDSAREFEPFLGCGPRGRMVAGELLWRSVAMPGRSQCRAADSSESTDSMNRSGISTVASPRPPWVWTTVWR